MRDVVVVSTARTPFGKFGGGLSKFSAMELAGFAIEEALKRAGITGDIVDESIIGNVIPAGLGQIPGRQAAVKGGIPHSVPSLSINKVCGSSLKSISLAAQMIKAGDADLIVTAGMESMSNAPYLSKKTRWGARMNNIEMVDAMVNDGLWCPDNDVHMAVIGGQVAVEKGIGRELQDKWALRSQERWAKAENNKFFDIERFPISVKSKKGEVVVDKDEAPRPESSLEVLSKMQPLFIKDGTITAANAPGVNDGATCVIIASRQKAEELGLPILATIKDYAQVSRESKYIATVPGLAIQKLMKKNNLSKEYFDVIEINEAFAAVPLVSGMSILGMTYEEMDEKVNPNGGAVAVGHPIGATGGRILMTLINELKRQNKKNGVCAICSGMAQGDAIWLELE